MKKASESFPGGKYDSSEISRRLYRGAVDAACRLEEQVRKASSLQELLCPEVTALRMRLKEYCERLMFSDPLEYGRKAEELMWWKVYHDIIQFYKQHRKIQGSPNDFGLKSHLMAGIGHYHHLLLRLQAEYNFNLKGNVDVPFIWQPRGIKKERWKKYQRSFEVDEKIKDWAHQACHRILICMGDLARYLDELGHEGRHLAERYYHQALALDPSFGMPHNQLGTLAGIINLGCDAAYHYMRCLQCPHSFEGAEGNIQRVFEKNRQTFKEVTEAEDNVNSAICVTKFLARFLRLCEQFFTLQEDSMQLLCQETLQSFDDCMHYSLDEVIRRSQQQSCDNNMNNSINNSSSLSSSKGVGGGSSRPSHLSDTLIFKLCIMSLMCIRRLQLKGSPLVSAAVAFTLTLFSHLLYHCYRHLYSVLYAVKAPTPKIADVQHVNNTKCGSDCGGVVTTTTTPVIRRSPDLNENESTKNEKTVDKCSRRPTKKGRSSAPRSLSRLRMLRRRRKVSSTSHEDSEFSDEDEPEVEESDVDEGTLVDNMHEIPSDNSDTGSCSSCCSMTEHEEEEEEEEEEEDAEEDDNNGQVTMTNGPTSVVNNNNNQQQKEGKHLHRENSQKHGKKHHGPSQNKNMIITAPPPAKNDSAATTKHVPNGLVLTVNAVNSCSNAKNAGPKNVNEPSSTPNTTDDKVFSKDVVLSSHDVLQVLEKDGLLPSVKILCDWLRINDEITTACAESSDILWLHTVDLLNLVVAAEKKILENEDASTQSLKQLKRSDGCWEQKWPLPEDLSLQGFPLLEKSHSKLRFDLVHSKRLSSAEKVFLRLQCILHFGHSLTACVQTGVTYNASTGHFSIPARKECPTRHLNGTVSPDNEGQVMAGSERLENQRKQLMRNMAHLWLKAEVSDLEVLVEGRAAPQLSPYLVPETGALCQHLNLLKQLVATKRFIIVIPSVVIANLDQLKRDSLGAREAIRWLESELRRGSRYLRAQKSQEKLSITPMKYPKKKNKEAWDFFQILECSNYLNHQGSSHDPTTPLVTLVTGNTTMLPPNASAIAQGAGINMENIEEFVSKWRNSSKSQG